MTAEEEFSLVSSNERDVRKLATAAMELDHQEICGLVGAKNQLLEVFLVRNVTTQPGRHEMDLEEIDAVREEITKNGYKHVGYFHSHPVSEAIPSEGDLSYLQDEDLALIYDVCGDNFRLWKKKQSACKEIGFKSS